MRGAWWLGLAVLVTPLAAFPSAWGIGLMQAKNVAFILLGLALVLALFPNRWLQAFSVWTLISFVFSGLFSASLIGLLGLFAWGLVYTVAYRLSTAEWSTVRKLITVSACVQVVWLGVQAASLDLLFQPISWWTGAPVEGPVPLVGWFANASDTALFLGLALPATLMVSPWMLVPLAGALVLLGSTAGIAALAGCLGWVAWRRWGGRGLVVAGLLVALGGGVFVTQIDHGRSHSRPWIITQQAWQLAQMRPVSGWGVNAVDTRLIIQRPRTRERWNFLFNEWLQGLVEVGAVGVLVALGYLGDLGRRLWRPGALRHAQELGLALGLLVGLSVISIPFRVGPVALLAACYLGRLDAVLNEA